MQIFRRESPRSRVGARYAAALPVSHGDDAHGRGLGWSPRCAVLAFTSRALHALRVAIGRRAFRGAFRRAFRHSGSSAAAPAPRPSKTHDAARRVDRGIAFLASHPWPLALAQRRALGQLIVVVVAAAACAGALAAARLTASGRGAGRGSGDGDIYALGQPLRERERKQYLRAEKTYTRRPFHET